MLPMVPMLLVVLAGAAVHLVQVRRGKLGVDLLPVLDLRRSLLSKLAVPP